MRPESCGGPLRLVAICAALCMAGLGAASARAGETPGTRVVASGPAWSSLSAAQRSALSPLERDWSSIDAARREKWLEVAARFPTMPAQERERVRQRMVEWARMSPAERTRARLQFQEARQISPQDRQARWEAYQALPEERRRELQERATPSASVAREADAKGVAATASGVKRNIVTAPKATAVRPVTPTVVQARPGATTTLMSQPRLPPAHHQAGLPKIAATEGFVDKDTLLPLRGPQGAATLLPAAEPGAEATP